MSWHLGPMACFDIESTGVDPFRDRIVTSAVIEVGKGRETRPFVWLLNPGIDIPEEATAVHGITTEMAAAGQDPASGVASITEELLRCAADGMPIVGHNVCYDLTLLWAECARHGHRELVTAIEDLAERGPVIDTMVIEKHLDPYRPGSPETAKGRRPDGACGKHTLVDCCRLWGVALHEADAHGAEADALAAGRLAWRLATSPERFASFDSHPTSRIDPGAYPLDHLHRWQAKTYASEAARFQAYMRGEQRRKPDDVDPTFVAPTSWPVQEPPADWSPDQLPAPREEVAA